MLSCLQIKHMMAFIDQEASEKAEEIDAKVSSTALTNSTMMITSVRSLSFSQICVCSRTSGPAADYESSKRIQLRHRLS